jgi:cysteine desulfurase/selenocysteine lyase
MARLTSPWRGDFPALGRTVRGLRLAYLDSAASAQKPQVVLDTLNELLGGAYANIHRGLYYNSAMTTAAYEDARGIIAAFLHAPSRGVVFTRNATEAVNLVAATWGRANLKKSDVLLLSEMEHHANIVPWQLLRDEIGFEIKVLPLDGDGTLAPEAVEAALKQGRVKFAALTQMSNVLGVRPPLAEIIPLLKAHDVTVLVDGAQGAAHGLGNFKALGADFYVATGHKLYGPTGIGCLVAAPELLDTLPPYQGGGDMIETVAWDKTTYAPAPARFEAGTPAFAEAVGWAAACEYVSGIGLEKIAAHEAALAERLQAELAAVQGFVGYGAGGGIVSFNLDGCQASDVATILDQCGVAVRSGHHCAMPLHARLGVAATVRVSLALYNDGEDIAQLAEALDKARAMLAR